MDEIDVIDELIGSEDKGTESEDSEKIEKDQYNKKYEEKIARIKKKISLESKMERKISIDYEVVEKYMVQFLEKYNIDEQIDGFVLDEINKFQNEDNIENITKNVSDSSNVLLFDIDVFYRIESYTKTLIRNALEKEKEKEVDDEKLEILSTIDTHIELTLSEAGIDKLTLVAYHYFIKNLENEAEKFIEAHYDKMPNINKQKTATSLYNKEVINILSKHSQMAAFTTTIISLTSSWLEKYRQKSVKLGKFINELMLITSEVLVDKISRYVMLIALKNKNPVLLRSLFSTFLSLIHRNIASMLSASVVNTKLGYFHAMQYLFEDSENQRTFNKQQIIANTLLKALKVKNRDKFKDNHVFQTTFQSLISPNFIDYFYFLDGNYAPLDSFYAYVMYGRYIRNSDNKKANSIVMSNKYKPRIHLKQAKKYIDIKVKQNIEPILYTIHDDEETVKFITDRLRAAISKEINPDSYITDDGEIAPLDITEVYDEIDLMTYRSRVLLQDLMVQNQQQETA